MLDQEEQAYSKAKEEARASRHKGDDASSVAPSAAGAPPPPARSISAPVASSRAVVPKTGLAAVARPKPVGIKKSVPASSVAATAENDDASIVSGTTAQDAPQLLASAAPPPMPLAPSSANASGPAHSAKIEATSAAKNWAAGAMQTL